MTLHPQSLAALQQWSQGASVSDPGFGPHELAAMRAEALALAAREPKEDVDRAENLDADGVPCRLYVPAGAAHEAIGVLVYLHGGGFALGDLETHDAQVRRVANRTGFAVLAVDYRRPPEHPFPAAPDDVDTVLAWLHRNASGRGLDLGRTVALGDSAGANLALVAAMRNPDVLAATVLVYPFVDPTTSAPSYAATDGGLTRADGQWYWRQYAGSAEDLQHPDLAPMLSDRLEVLPPTLVQIAEHDVLADEDRELVRRIETSGVVVEATTYAGMIHGFWRHPDQFDAAEEALAEAAAFIDRHVPQGL